MIDAEFSESFDQIYWKITTNSIPLIALLVKEVLLRAARELVRNAALHDRGNKDQKLELTITVERITNLYLCIADNGVDFGAKKLKQITTR